MIPTLKELARRLRWPIYLARCVMAELHRAGHVLRGSGVTATPWPGKARGMGCAARAWCLAAALRGGEAG